MYAAKLTGHLYPAFRADRQVIADFRGFPGDDAEEDAEEEAPGQVDEAVESGERAPANDAGRNSQTSGIGPRWAGSSGSKLGIKISFSPFSLLPQGLVLMFFTTHPNSNRSGVFSLIPSGVGGRGAKAAGWGCFED